MALGSLLQLNDRIIGAVPNSFLPFPIDIYHVKKWHYTIKFQMNLSFCVKNSPLFDAQILKNMLKSLPDSLMSNIIEVIYPASFGGLT